MANVEFTPTYTVQSKVQIEGDKGELLTITREQMYDESPISFSDYEPGFWCLYGDGVDNKFFNTNDNLLDFFKRNCNFGWGNGVEVEGNSELREYPERRSHS